MQLRHIRPGSLEWLESKTEEVEQGVERLTPEEIRRLRSMSDGKANDRRQASAPAADASMKL